MKNFLAVSLTLLALTSGLCAREATTVTVDPFINHVVNGVGELQAMNGLAVNGGSRMEQVNETMALRPDTFKVFLYVKALPLHWKVVKKMMKTREGNEELQALMAKIDIDKVVSAWFDRAMGIDSKTGLRIPGKRYSPQFQQLEQLQAWNARKKVVLYMLQPHPVDKENFAFYSAFFNACLNEFKQRFPDLGPLYVMIFNEPDYEYQRAWAKKGITESISFFYDFFNHVDTAMRKAHPDVTLIGPGISRFMDWRNWKNWTVPFLKQAPQTNYFNAQPYCRRFTDLASWSEMLQAESLKLNGKRVPLVLTEANFGGMSSPGPEWWKDELNVQRVFDEARAMFGLLSRPDQYAMKHFFIYHYKHKFADMWYEQDGVVKNTPAYHLYWLLRDLKGKRCLAEVNREASPIRAVAAKDGTTVTLALFNQSQTPVSTTLAVRWPAGILEPPCVVEYLRYNADKKAFSHGVEPKDHFPKTLNFAPGEVKKIRYVYSPTKAVAMQPLQEKSYYAKETAVVIGNAAQRLTIKARKASQGETVRLRLALYLDDLLAVDRIAWTLNGHAMEARFAPEAYDRDRVTPIIHVDCTVPSDWVGGENTLEFAPLTDSTYRLMFSALILRPYPQDFPPLKRSDAFVKAPNPVDLAMTLPRFVEPGKVPLSLTVTNSTTASKESELKLVLPEGWTIMDCPTQFTVAANSEKVIRPTVNVPSGRMRSQAYISATLLTPGQHAVTIRRGCDYQVPFQAEHATRAPNLDGALTEWNMDSFIREKHQGAGVKTPFTTAFAAQWDKTNLYLAVKVEGRPLDSLPVETEYWWKHDTLEVFLDFWNAKKANRDHRTMQVWIALHALADNGPRWSTVPNDPNACTLKGTSPQTFRIKVVEGANGFTMEAALDWNALSGGWEGNSDRFTPTPGAIVGCETTLASRSLIGSRVKAYSKPAKWGNLKLLRKGLKVKQAADEILLDTSLKAKPMGNASATPPRFRFSPTSTADWTFPPEAQLDVAGLHLPNNHSTLLLNKPAATGLNEKGVTVNITLSGFEKTGESTTSLSSHARIFLTPQAEKSNEPYTMQEMICLLVDYKEHGDATLSLYRKNATGKNWGKLIWSGAMARDEFPLTLSLTLTAKTYRIRSDTPLLPVNGSLSGQHSLAGAAWSGPLRFGVKSCFGSRPGTVAIKKITID